MARMKFKNAWNYDSAARQVDTGDFDFILDQDTDVGKAFYDVVQEAISLGMVDFIETFAEENNLLTQPEADALYELIGAVAAHVLEADPHAQYATADELATAISGIDLSAYYTKIEADALFEAIGAAAAAISAHNAASDPHTEYQKESEKAQANGYPSLDGSTKVPIAQLPTGTSSSTVALGDAAAAAVTAHEAASNPHPVYLTQAEADALYDGTGSVGAHVADSDPHTQYQRESEKGQNSGYASLDSSGDLPLTQLPDHTHVDSSSGGAIAVFPTRATATITTASLAASAVETGTVTLAAAYRLMQLSTDRACRIRLYTTSAKRTADASRGVGVDPVQNTDHGLIFEFVATAAITDYDLSPLVDGYCRSGTTVYYSIENRSGGTSTVTVDIDWLRQE